MIKTSGYLLACMLLLFSACTSGPLKVFYVNSYHQGYPPSDEITRAVKEGFSSDSFQLSIAYLDSKHSPWDSLVTGTPGRVFRIIQEQKPDIVIVSDDFAVKNLVLPLLKGQQIPVVFCGVNWSATGYGLPEKNITGILEVLPLREIIQLFRDRYPDLHNLTILSENSLSETQNSILLDTLYRSMGLRPAYRMVNDFAEWKQYFLEAMQNSDMVYLPTNGSIAHWNDEEAVEFVHENIRRPVFTCDAFMMPYCVAGLTKVAYEQGARASETAKRILRGTLPLEIPLSQNSLAEYWINPELANKIGFNTGRGKWQIFKTVDDSNKK